MESHIRPIRVVKVGGSLFDFERAAVELRRWLSGQPSTTNVLIAGGGAPVDSVRRLQKKWRVDDSTAHWTAIEMLDVNSRILLKWLPEFMLIDDPAEIFRSSENDSQLIFTTEKWLRGYSRLPQSWDVTSDSIAAEVAQALRKEPARVELVLLKSKLPEPRLTNEGSRLTDIVDRYFFEAAKRLDIVKIVNLRSEGFKSVDLSVRLLSPNVRGKTTCG